MNRLMNWKDFRRGFWLALAAALIVWGLSTRATAEDKPRTWKVRIQPQGRRVVAAPQTAQAAPKIAVPLPRATQKPAASARRVIRFPDEDWTVTIVPNEKTDVEIHGRSYNDVYRSIPYRRTEYLANPSYRHDATMELLFGKLRPTTIVRQYTPKVVKTPKYTVYKPYLASQRELYWSSGTYLGPFGWRYRWGPSYPVYPRRPLLY